MQHTGASRITASDYIRMHSRQAPKSCVRGYEYVCIMTQNLGVQGPYGITYGRIVIVSPLVLCPRHATTALYGGGAFFRTLIGATMHNSCTALALAISLASLSACSPNKLETTVQAAKASETKTLRVIGTEQPWASEAIYFVLTDRFVDGDKSNNYEQQGADIDAGQWHSFNHCIPDR